MSRDTVAAVTSAASLPQINYSLLTMINSLSGGAVRCCTGGRFIFDGVNTWSPVGGLGGLDPVVEDSEPFPRAVRLWLAAVSTSQVVDVVQENLFNRPVTIYRCFLTEGASIVGTPQLLWVGNINKVSMKTNDPKRGNYYEVEAESRLRRVSRAQYYDQYTLQVIFGNSSDTFFSFVPFIPLRRAPWGLLPYGVGGPISNLPGGQTAYPPGVGYGGGGNANQ